MYLVPTESDLPVFTVSQELSDLFISTIEYFCANATSTPEM